LTKIAHIKSHPMICSYSGIYSKKISCSIITHYMDVLYGSSTISCFHSNIRT